MPVIDRTATQYVVHVPDATFDIEADRVEVCDEVIIFHLKNKVVAVFATFDYLVEKKAE